MGTIFTLSRVVSGLPKGSENGLSEATAKAGRHVILGKLCFSAVSLTGLSL